MARPEISGQRLQLVHHSGDLRLARRAATTATVVPATAATAASAGAHAVVVTRRHGSHRAVSLLTDSVGVGAARVKRRARPTRTNSIRATGTTSGVCAAHCSRGFCGAHGAHAPFWVIAGENVASFVKILLVGNRVSSGGSVFQLYRQD